MKIYVPTALMFVYLIGGSSIAQYVRYTDCSPITATIMSSWTHDASKNLQTFFKPTQSGSNAFITAVSS